MNRHTFTTNKPRKRWIGDGFCVLRASDFRIKANRESKFDKIKENFESLGKLLGADETLTEITPVQDEKRPYEIIFKADYYTFK